MGTLDRDFVPPCPKHQADAYLSQANPVSAEWYPVLDTVANVRIISIATNITWATTQPTPLEVRVIIDGNTLIYVRTNPVNGTFYYPKVESSLAEGSQTLQSTTDYSVYRWMVEGRSVKVDVRITWATTQPTPLLCRVKWAKW